MKKQNRKLAALGISALSLAALAVPTTVQAANTGCVLPKGAQVVTLGKNCTAEQLQAYLDKYCATGKVQEYLNKYCETGNIQDCLNQGCENNAGADAENNAGADQNQNAEESPDGDSTQLSYAQQVVKLVNEERAKEGLAPLTMQENLTAAANVRAKEIQTSFSHTRPDGSSFSSVLREEGIHYRASGENIAYGQKTPQQVVQGWMGSAGHRANIMSSSFQSIGVGYQTSQNKTPYWVQLFTA